MPTAELITIGTELLLGEILDTNTRYLARKLKDNNIDLFRITMIGDNVDRIAALIQEALLRADIIITTGGLGPTVDDPTREAVAKSFGVHLEYYPNLWEEIKDRFSRRLITPTENNKRQAFLPLGAQVIHNPVGTAPAFYIRKNSKIVICLPGVPREMETLTESEVIPLLKNDYKISGIIKVRIIHVAGIGESVVDEAIGKFEKLANPTVGLLAHPGIVDIRISAKAFSEAEADRMIAKIEKEITAIFSNNIYGFDDESIFQTVNQLASIKKKKIVVNFSGFPSQIFDESFKQFPYLVLLFSGKPAAKNSNAENEINIDATLTSTNSECTVNFTLHSTPPIQETKMYNGPVSQGPIWALNLVFESIRQFLLSSQNSERE